MKPEVPPITPIKDVLPPVPAVLNACSPGAWEKVGGIPLVARALFHLRKLGMSRVILVSGDDHGLEELRPWQRDLQVQQVGAEKSVPDTVLAQVGEGSILYLDAAHLIDPRILGALQTAEETTLAFTRPADREDAKVRAGLLTRDDFRLWAEEGEARLVRKARALFPGEMDPFCPEIRGPRIPYFMEIRSRDEARQATWLLIRGQQKQVMDLPAQYLDPPFENALTYLLCRTPVSPNMVTFSCLAVALTVAWLFWQCQFVAGALGTFAVEILDGVDGKLARTKLQFSRLGEHEDVLDYLYENSWYVALGVGLTKMAGTVQPAFLAGLMVLADTADNIFYNLGGRWYGKSIDLFGPFDSAFRRVAGRRNIYGIMFIVGFSLGFPLQTFAVAASWAVVTAGIHGGRLLLYGRSGKKVPRRA